MAALVLLVKVVMAALVLLVKVACAAGPPTRRQAMRTPAGISPRRSFVLRRVRAGRCLLSGH
jgi:hypothetical protein